MTAATLALKQRAAWKKLQAHFKVMGRRHLRDVFAEDPDRGVHLTLEAAGIYLDYPRNRVTRRTLELLVELAEESGLRNGVAASPNHDSSTNTLIRRLARTQAEQAAKSVSA
jgi:glucose-6-phosphate isomerase